MIEVSGKGNNLGSGLDFIHHTEMKLCGTRASLFNDVAVVGAVRNRRTDFSAHSLGRLAFDHRITEVLVRMGLLKVHSSHLS